MSVKQNEAPVIITERRTMELCGSEHGGVRCVRPCHHDGEHESYRVNAGPIRWK